jgi:hypothetical protein
MIEIFNGLVAPLNAGGKRLNQHVPEWRTFLEYASGYFGTRNIDRPVVVEIGVLDGAQRGFYEDLLGAEYIGIDVNPKSPADIVGDSAALETVNRLAWMLGSRAIDLLFIDGCHTYEGVKADYEIYGPMTRHIVAIHDIHTPKLDARDKTEVFRLWNEILATNRTDTLVTIQAHNDRDPRRFNGRQLGIGLVIKGGNE